MVPHEPSEHPDIHTAEETLVQQEPAHKPAPGAQVITLPPPSTGFRPDGMYASEGDPESAARYKRLVDRWKD